MVKTKRGMKVNQKNERIKIVLKLEVSNICEQTFQHIFER